jgi:hypothetical protein
MVHELRCAPRSLMLSIIARANHSQLTYRGSQAPIVHLQADVHRTIDWAEEQSQAWTFTDTNAAASYAHFFKDRAHLTEINWDAQAELDAAQVYTPEQVDEYVRLYLSGVERGQLAPIQDACVANIGMIWTKRAR